MFKGAAFWALFLSVFFGTTVWAGQVTVQPEVIDDVLLNPGIGFTSFMRPDSDPVDGDGWHPATTIAYYRWYWDQIETADGVYNFEVIDQAIAAAERCGQKFSFRIMCADNSYNPVPTCLQSRIPGNLHRDGGFVPDFNSEAFLEYSLRLVQALGQRYDGNPAIDHVDIGTIGVWGEWHIAEVPNAPEVTTATCNRVLEAYRRAFPRTTLIVLINSVDALKRCADMGLGWRADCLGDLGEWATPENGYWNHHKDKYPVNLAAAAAEDNWKREPVIFEICIDVPHCKEKGFSVDEILNYALGYHVSVFNAKSIAVPKEWQPAFESFLKRMGYRLWVSEFTFPETVVRGEAIQVRSVWMNGGVAPPYKHYRIAYRLRPLNGGAILSSVSSIDVGALLPGSWVVEDAFAVPPETVPGAYSLEIAVLDPQVNTPVIRLANSGRRDDGWYPVGTLRVK